MKELVEAIAKALVDNPDQVQVRAIEGEQVTVFELRVHASDLGILIGRQGRNAEAIRTILNGVGMKLLNLFGCFVETMSPFPQGTKVRLVPSPRNRYWRE
jgi:uncharacterized protein